MTGLSDSFQRPINYLRLSVTDRCNLHCHYCQPDGGPCFIPRPELLTFEELSLVVRAAVALGVNKVRLTGGEPLVRRDIVRLVKMLSGIKGVDDLALTTNGMLLSRFALALKKAGLKRVNISLDSLRPERFKTITGRDGLEQVLQAIGRAQQVGLNPVKVNMVLLKGINEDEILDFAQRTINDGWNVRFIELMPFGRAGDGEFLSIAEVAQRISAIGEMEPCLPKAGGGPAKYFRLPGASGTVGFIGAITEHFCFGCNRLRLTAEGKLRLCLLGDEEIDLRPALRSGASLEEIKGIIQQAASIKPEGHRIAEGIAPKHKTMSRIGG